MPLQILMGDDAEKHMEALADMREAKVLAGDIAECRTETTRAVGEMHAMLSRVYLMFGAAMVALLAAVVVVVAVVLTHA